MNKELLLETIKTEKSVRQEKRKKDSKNIKDFSWVPFFAGEEYNQILAQEQELQKNINDNTLDFSQLGDKEGGFIEEKIKQICNNAKNKQLIDSGDYPIIWFKNIEKIKSGSALENSLLPVFDPWQNSELFSEKLDLSKYILIATSSTRDMGQLPPPLTSRLDCMNVKTAEPKKFFLDKYFSWILAGSILLIIALLLVIFWPNKAKEAEKKS